jgi:3-methylfumaryl-CoA hydratase
MSEFSERTEMLLPEPAQALGALLGVPVPDLARGEGLPLLWHWVYLLDRPAQADLGPDGVAMGETASAFPGTGGRRMWAGGRVRASGPLRCGDLATKRSRVLRVRERPGRSGQLTFITVEHQVLQRDHVVIDEQRDIVYRQAAPGDGQPPAPSGDGPSVPPAGGEWAIEVSPTLLFRFSALTYNAHRIHYDRDYARDVEGYPGLVVHGPLQAMLMAEAVRRRRPVAHSGTRFAYRLVAPVFDHEGLVVSASTADPSAGEDRGQPEPTGAAPTDLTTRVRSRVAGHTSATGIYRPGPCSRPAS